jgi:uroporphyrinogen-III synthase
MTESIVQQPLRDRTLLVTRAREQAAALSERLQALGARTVEFPVIRLEPPADWGPLDRALHRLSSGLEEGHPCYDRLIFTSVNGVRFCLERLQSLGLSTALLQRVPVVAIGPATAAALAARGVSGVLVPEEYVAEQVAETLLAEYRRRGEQPQGRRLLVVRAAEARRVLVEILQGAGLLVDEVPAYRTLPVASDDEQGRSVLSLLQRRQLDMLTFTSSSTVRFFMRWLAGLETVGEPAAFLQRQGVLVACIGPVTAATARELGLVVAVEARTFTVDGLVAAIVDYYLRSQLPRLPGLLPG